MIIFISYFLYSHVKIYPKIKENNILLFYFNVNKIFTPMFFLFQNIRK